MQHDLRGIRKYLTLRLPCVLSVFPFPRQEVLEVVVEFIPQARLSNLQPVGTHRMQASGLTEGLSGRIAHISIHGRSFIVVALPIRPCYQTSSNPCERF